MMRAVSNVAWHARQSVAEPAGPATDSTEHQQGNASQCAQTRVPNTTQRSLRRNGAIDRSRCQKTCRTRRRLGTPKVSSFSQSSHRCERMDSRYRGGTQNVASTSQRCICSSNVRTYRRRTSATSCQHASCGAPIAKRHARLAIQRHRMKSKVAFDGKSPDRTLALSSPHSKQCTICWHHWILSSVFGGVGRP